MQRIDVDLEAHELPWRTLYGTPEFVSWLDDALATMDSKVSEVADMTPSEQIAVMLVEYVAGEPFSDDRRFKSLSCTPQRFIWEMKSDDVRIFGWVPNMNSFVCCFGDLKDTIILNNSYGAYIARTVYVREHIGLDEPRFIPSREHVDVVSPRH